MFLIGGDAAKKNRSQSAEGQKKKKQEVNLMQQSVYGTLDEKQTAMQRRAAAREAAKVQSVLFCADYSTGEKY